MEPRYRTTALHLALGVLGLVGMMLAACSTIVEEDKLIAQGEELYLMNCARCHQLDGLGVEGLYPNLAGNPVVTLHDPGPLIQTVKYGRGGMPPFRTELTNTELAALLSYLRNAWDNDAPAVTPKRAR